MEKAESRTRKFSWLVCDDAPPEVRRRYIIGFVWSMSSYIVLLSVSLWLLRDMPEGPWRIPVALAPMIPMVFMLRGYLWYLRQIDELQRQIQLEALAIGFAGTAVTTFGYGFLENVGFPNISWFMVWPLMSLFWVVGHVLAKRRYR